jgi:hypothetical protein
MLARQITRSDAATPFLPITSLQTQQFHAITHSFAQRQSNIPIISNALRPLSVATWVAPPFHSNASPVSLQPQNLRPLCFHNDTNCFSRKPFILTTIRIARGWGVRDLV